MPSVTLTDGPDAFDVMVLEPASQASHVLLFAVGAGGRPERHLPLLTALSESGCTVVAPQFEPLASPMPTADELQLRARRLSLALNSTHQPGAVVTAVGHSIGAAVLLALAGGQMWLGPGRQLDIRSDPRITRLVLMAPPTGFFQADGALNGVATPILAWAGTQDTITPPGQMAVLETGLADHVPKHFRVTEGAGHFSFMDQPPPHSVEPLPDRQAFLYELAREIKTFLID